MVIEDILIRNMLDDDIEIVHAIECMCNADAWSLKIFRDCFQMGYCCLVMEQAKTIIGFAILTSSVEEAHLLNIALHPQWQRKGLGEHLLSYCIEKSKELDADMLYLEVRKSNFPARKLYEKFSFTEIGLRKGYYPTRQGNEREDALVLALGLGV